MEALEILDLTEPEPEPEMEPEAAPEPEPESDFLQLEPEASPPLQELSYEAFEGSIDSTADRQLTDAAVNRQHMPSTAQRHAMPSHGLPPPKRLQ